MTKNFINSIASDFENLLSIMTYYIKDTIEKADDKNTVKRQLIEVLEINQKAKDIVTRVIDRNFQPELNHKIRMAHFIADYVKALKKRLPESVKVRTRFTNEKMKALLSDEDSFSRTLNETVTFILKNNSQKEVTIETEISDSIPGDDLDSETEAGPYDVISIYTRAPQRDDKEIKAKDHLTVKETNNELKKWIRHVIRRHNNNQCQITIFKKQEGSPDVGVRLYFPSLGEAN